MCCSAARVWAVLAGVCGLLQGVAWLALGIAALAFYNCELKVLGQPGQGEQPSPGLLLYVVYFYNPKCVSPEDPALGWPTELVATAERTWQWAITYIVLSATWAFVSIALLVTGSVWCRSSCWRGSVLFSWLLVTLAVLVADVVATIHYGLDVGTVLEGGSLLSLLEDAVLPGSEVANFLERITSPLATIPSIAMLLATSRCLLLWAINLILWFAIAFSFCRVTRKPRQEEPISPSATSTVRHEELTWRGTNSQETQDHGREGRGRLNNYDETRGRPNNNEMAMRGGTNSYEGTRGGHYNEAFQNYDEANDEVPGPVKFRGSYASDDTRPAPGNRNSRLSVTPAELRGQLPWSYLTPDEPQHVAREPPHEAEEWRLPRPTYTSSAPPMQHFYHFPYPPTGQPASQYQQQTPFNQNIYRP